MNDREYQKLESQVLNTLGYAEKKRIEDLSKKVVFEDYKKSLTMEDMINIIGGASK